jgi:hypothetical protein
VIITIVSACLHDEKFKSIQRRAAHHSEIPVEPEDHAARQSPGRSTRQKCEWDNCAPYNILEIIIPAASGCPTSTPVRPN